MVLPPPALAQVTCTAWSLQVTLEEAAVQRTSERPGRLATVDRSVPCWRLSSSLRSLDMKGRPVSNLRGRLKA